MRYVKNALMKTIGNEIVTHTIVTVVAWMIKWKLHDGGDVSDGDGDGGDVSDEDDNCDNDCGYDNDVDVEHA